MTRVGNSACSGCGTCERCERAAYMRGWNARHAERLRIEKRARYRTDEEWRAERIRVQRLADLRKRGGVDDDTEAMLPVLKVDPCAYCGEQMATPDRESPDSAAIDHIDPAGDSHWTNLAGACRSCNASKGKMPLLLSMLERQLRRDLTPLAEQIFLIKGRTSQRRRIDF